MKALFRRIDKINRVAHDNAVIISQQYALAHHRAHARINTHSQETRAKNGRDIGRVENTRRVSFPNSVTVERQGESA